MAKKSRNRFEEEDRLGLGLAMLEEILLDCPESGVHERTPGSKVCLDTVKSQKHTLARFFRKG